MRAIIPVAGIGTRLRPHTYSIPKVLLNVAGKPILAHILDKIFREGITEASIIVGYMGEQIREFVSSAYPGFNVEYIEQDETLGLGHAIYLARHSMTTDPVLIILGDTIFDVDLAPVLEGPYSSLGVKTVDDPRRFGVAELRDGFISRLVEKPETPISNLAIVGLYYIRSPRLLIESLNAMIDGGIKTRGEFQLTDALQMMIEKGEKMTVFPVEGWYDCGKPETLLGTNRALLEKESRIPVLDGVVIIPPAYVAGTATLERCVIGPNTTVADHAIIQDSVIRNSIIGAKAQVLKAILDNSIVGPDAVVRGTHRRINVGDSSEVEFS